jgi:hypothetical protein
VIVVAILFNSFCTIFHSYDTANSDQTLRYKLGSTVFFVMFMALISIQFYVMVEGFVYYYLWR